MSTKAVIGGHKIRRLDTVTEAHVRGLAELLIDCVDGDASVSFMHPLAVPKALDFWHRIAHGVARGERALLVAEDAGGVVGTVQLILDQPENQPHRADLSKMLVHRRARRQGLGEGLLRAAEDVARDCGKSLLVLDTASAAAASSQGTPCCRVADCVTPPTSTERWIPSHSQSERTALQASAAIACDAAAPEN